MTANCWPHARRTPRLRYGSCILRKHPAKFSWQQRGLRDRI
uniref:Uncharacterized protein n=1 Tax=Triticum urartu TaxID=4572 RepID=A0A8R7PW80_TRIUA